MSTIGSSRIKEVAVDLSGKRHKVKQIWVGKNLVYSAGSTVTYHVDSSTVYTEEVESGSSCLSPTTFTPTKSGYTFVGWRQDTTASSSVLSSLKMEYSPITLYAVFAKAITLTYYSSSTAESVTGLAYYNNGNITYPTFTVENPTLSGWTFSGWTTGTGATSSIAYSSISNTTLTASITLYARYWQTITLSYNGNSATSGSVGNQTGTRYYNAAGNYSNPTFTLASNGYTKTNYVFLAWGYGSASGTQYAAGATVTLSESKTFYAVWSVVCRILLQYWWHYQAETDDNDDGYVVIRIYNMATGSEIYTAFHYYGTGYSAGATTHGLNAEDYAGAVRVKFTGTGGRNARYTALTTLYSNSSLSTVGISSGNYVTVSYVEAQYVYNTYYVAYNQLSL